MLQARIALLLFATILMAAAWSSDQTHQVATKQAMISSHRVMYRNQIPLKKRPKNISFSGTSIRHPQTVAHYCHVERTEQPSVQSQPALSDSQNRIHQQELAFYSPWLELSKKH